MRTFWKRNAWPIVGLVLLVVAIVPRAEELANMIGYAALGFGVLYAIFWIGGRR